MFFILGIAAMIFIGGIIPAMLVDFGYRVAMYFGYMPLPGDVAFAFIVIYTLVVIGATLSGVIPYLGVCFLLVCSFLWAGATGRTGWAEYGTHVTTAPFVYVFTGLLKKTPDVPAKVDNVQTL